MPCAHIDLLFTAHSDLDVNFKQPCFDIFTLLLRFHFQKKLNSNLHLTCHSEQSAEYLLTFKILHEHIHRFYERCDYQYVAVLFLSWSHLQGVIL